jgi:hypothetical protein
MRTSVDEIASCVPAYLQRNGTGVMNLPIQHSSSDDEALRLAKAFFAIHDQKVRRIIVALVEAVAKSDADVSKAPLLS